MNKETYNLSPEEQARIFNLYNDYRDWKAEDPEDEELRKARAYISALTKKKPTDPEINEFITFMAGNDKALSLFGFNLDYDDVLEAFKGYEDNLDN